MRVTQSMLSSNMLRNLSSSYNKMGKLQNQLTSGKKVNRPSDDPVVAMKGMGYRFQVDKINQFKRNLGEANNWLDNTDEALNHVGTILKRTQELMTNVPTDTMTHDDRQKVLEELKQMKESLLDVANSKVGDKYIFNGTKTGEPLYDGTGFANFQGGTTSSVEIEVFDGISLQVNIEGKKIFEGIDDMFDKMTKAIATEDPNDPDYVANLDEFLTDIQKQMDGVLEARAVVGARQNRAELMGNRLDVQEVSARKQMSENEDVDYAEVITEMITQESIHRAALSIGARIIQPSLVDFLR